MSDEDEAGWRSYEARFERAEAAAAAERERAADPGLRHRVTTTRLTTQQPTLKAILEFEENNPGTGGAKAGLIRETFDLSETRYYQTLLHLIDTPEALEHNPMLVHRLRDRRDRRNKARADRTLITR